MSNGGLPEWYEAEREWEHFEEERAMEEAEFLIELRGGTDDQMYRDAIIEQYMATEHDAFVNRRRKRKRR